MKQGLLGNGFFWGGLLKGLTLAALPLGLVVSGAAAQAQSVETFAKKFEDSLQDGLFRVKEDTLVQFEFVQSNGAYKTSFGVINLETGARTPLIIETKNSDVFQDENRPSDFQTDLSAGNAKDFRGTPGNSVPEAKRDYLFVAGVPYAFYIESTWKGKPAGIIYSNNQVRSKVEGAPPAQLTGFEIPDVLIEGGFAALTSGQGVLLRWDDTGSQLVKIKDQDRDYDDFVVIAGGIPCIVESVETAPATP